MCRRPLAAVAAFLFVLAAAPAAHAATTVVNVTKRGTSQSEAAVAASPLDANDVVVAANVQRCYGITVGVSHDGGLTWARSIIGDDDRFGLACCDSSISWDASGNLFLAWLGFTNKPFPTVVPILISTDAGDSWARLAQIKPPKPLRSARTTSVPLVRAADGGREDEEERGGFIDQPTITTGRSSLMVRFRK